MIKTKEVSRIKLILTLIICFALLIFGIYRLNIENTQRLDRDCIEWGVQIENPDGTKGWALTPAIPRSKEEAEEMAKYLESQDRGGRYYEAKCKRYKGE